MKTVITLVVASLLLSGCATPVQNLAAGVAVGAIGSTLLSRPRYYEAPRYYEQRYYEPRCFWRHGRRWCER